MIAYLLTCMLLVAIASLVILVRAISHAQDGYEDETGYHLQFPAKPVRSKKLVENIGNQITVTCGSVVEKHSTWLPPVKSSGLKLKSIVGNDKARPTGKWWRHTK